ncbi:hypothetical protein C8J57DRAFT_1674815 [Mycena rebaudengoi]|nr:hypothetical protein C8J57DRAFT_1674815 [Mycena rebaudengoi]
MRFRLTFAFIAARLTIPDMLAAQRSAHWMIVSSQSIVHLYHLGNNPIESLCFLMACFTAVVAFPHQPMSPDAISSEATSSPIHLSLGREIGQQLTPRDLVEANQTQIVHRFSPRKHESLRRSSPAQDFDLMLNVDIGIGPGPVPDTTSNSANTEATTSNPGTSTSSSFSQEETSTAPIPRTSTSSSPSRNTTPTAPNPGTSTSSSPSRNTTSTTPNPGTSTSSSPSQTFTSSPPLIKRKSNIGPAVGGTMGGLVLMLIGIGVWLCLHKRRKAQKPPLPILEQETSTAPIPRTSTSSSPSRNTTPTAPIPRTSTSSSPSRNTTPTAPNPGTSTSSSPSRNTTSTAPNPGTSTSSSPSQTFTSSPPLIKRKSNIGPAVGGTMGGLVLMLIGIGVWLCLHKRRKAGDRDQITVFRASPTKGHRTNDPVAPSNQDGMPIMRSIQKMRRGKNRAVNHASDGAHAVVDVLTKTPGRVQLTPAQAFRADSGQLPNELSHNPVDAFPASNVEEIHPPGIASRNGPVDPIIWSELRGLVRAEVEAHLVARRGSLQALPSYNSHESEEEDR